VDSGATWRGGQRQVLLLTLGLRDLGHEPFLIGAPDSPLVERARAAGLPASAIPMAGDWDIRAAQRIRARMRAWNVDLVHAHDARSHAVSMIALAGKSDIPLIVTRRVAFPPRSVRLKYGPRVARFVAISQAVKNAMSDAGVDKSRITVVHSGIAPKEAVVPRDWRSELAWPEDVVIGGMVGAMTREKGAESLPAIVKSVPPSERERLRFVLLGGQAQGTVEMEGVQVHSAGFVMDIDPAVAGLDMLLHPSSNEGLGTAVIDAMALGVPSIAFSVGGIPEVIENEISGLLIPPRDPESFARAISRLAGDAALRARLGEGGRHRAAQFNADSMTQQTEAVYNEVLSG
jgi:glycosyltransferase involved in cell wall biosynthesis